MAAWDMYKTTFSRITLERELPGYPASHAEIFVIKKQPKKKKKNKN